MSTGRRAQRCRRSASGSSTTDGRENYPHSSLSPDIVATKKMTNASWQTTHRASIRRTGGKRPDTPPNGKNRNSRRKSACAPLRKSPVHWQGVRNWLPDSGREYADRFPAGHCVHRNSREREQRERLRLSHHHGKPGLRESPPGTCCPAPAG